MSQSSEGWSWDHVPIRAALAAPSQGVKMFLTRNLEASFTSPKGWGGKSAAILILNVDNLVSHFFLPHFYINTDITRPATSWPLSLLCLPHQQVKLQCQLSHTKLPVNWVMLQGPFTVICPKEIYAKCSANLGSRHICCICLSASKQEELLHLDDIAAKATPQRQMGWAGSKYLIPKSNDFPTKRQAPTLSME